MTTTSSTSRRSSSELHPLDLNGRTAVDQTDASGATLHIRCSTRVDGDFNATTVPADELEARRRGFVDLPWTMLDEHHGTTVVRVSEPGDGDGARGDVAITTCDDAVLGCWVGDCAPIVLVGERDEFAVVHAGWRGLAAGVVDTAVAAFQTPVARAVLGPCIGACCYEFGADDLAAVAAGVHADVAAVAGTTRTGAVALDVTAAVRAACTAHGIELALLGACTGCTYDGSSHRVRRDRSRHVVAAWRTR